MIDYATAACTYDNTRQPSDEVIDRFHHRIAFARTTCVLDFGCGTGNYLQRIQVRFGCRCRGVEPSAAMRAKAIAKSSESHVVAGDHARIPFPSGEFDFAYMTDVIHHVPDRAAMFGELHRVLKPGGRLCIVTQSHAQIEARFYCRYFPSLAAIDQRRYPALDELVAEASAAGLALLIDEEIAPSARSTVTETFVRNVAERNYSVFRLLPEQEFVAGLAALRADLGPTFETPAAGLALLWFCRPARGSTG